jgi:hypothetical protein
VAARHERPLKPFDKILPYYVNTMDDPNLERYAAEEFAGQVFATDAVLAHLMTCGRSVRGGREGEEEGGRERGREGGRNDSMISTSHSRADR